MAELDIDLLVLNAVDVDLDDVGDREQPLAQGFGSLLQLGKIGTVAGQGVHDRVDIAIFVVDIGSMSPAGSSGGDR